VALEAIAEETKINLALLEGLERDDVSRWPGGLFRRAYVRTYAQKIGLDPEQGPSRVRRSPPRSRVRGTSPVEALAENLCRERPKNAHRIDDCGTAGLRPQRTKHCVVW
jgi:cytoskeletal protein RodZ